MMISVLKMMLAANSLGLKQGRVLARRLSQVGLYRQALNFALILDGFQTENDGNQDSASNTIGHVSIAFAPKVDEEPSEGANF